LRIKRPALVKLSLLTILIPLGLLTKFYSGIGSDFVTNYLGGVIYVVFFILLASLVFPKTSPIRISLIVLCITCLLEFTQLIQIDFLNRLRQSFIIRALIGSVFNVLDFVFYLTGAVIGYIILLLNIKHGENISHRRCWI
jgi:hypothetical protein